jgi:hypothetical protein
MSPPQDGLNQVGIEAVYVPDEMPVEPPPPAKVAVPPLKTAAANMGGRR